MSKLERITVTMPEEMAARLRAAVDSGAYATTSEIVREALRDWAEDQERRAASLARLHELVEEGRKGPFYDGPAAMAELRAKYEAKVRQG
ncbi:MAG: type II toxin-antitoxin system ParD family antitoxin [Sphingomonadales bacterium]|nr:type II toxin-antitoxin system ParD family antitoxin [Sphingomonadales bacterium]